MDKEDLDHFRTIASASLKQPTGLSKRQGAVTSSLPRDPHYTLQKAKMIFSCYRKDQVPEPESYIAAVAAILAGYPKFIVDYACDPRTGITGKNKWPPSVAEVNEFCELHMRKIEEDEAREVRRKRQLEEREEWQNQVPTKTLLDAGKAWLDRTDPLAQRLSGQSAKVKLTDIEKKAALENAAKVGSQLSGMKLLPETIETLSLPSQTPDDYQT